MKDAPLLHADGLTRVFAGLRALDDYALELFPREIVGIIGPNGAGKTTAFNLLTGFVRPTSGSLVIGGRKISGARPDQIARLGVARTFQNIRLFRSLSVLDNVLVAVQLHGATALPAVLASLPSFRKRERSLRDEALEWLTLLGLHQVAHQRADSLAYGDQRRLEIARAMAARPQVLLLDEPAAGMNASETDALLELIGALRDRYGVAVVLIEHDMRLVMRLCERIQVLNYGRLIASGPPDAVRHDPAVIEAYLGQGGEETLDA
jgi:branched-chain amino acid transport system ATP-binding protein